ncbi:MAG: M48 family metalloprotease [Acidobacteriia bacterium]|nr:M48 family metalloprotease [Terriglobia bacterium]
MKSQTLATRCPAALLAFCLAAPQLLQARVEPSHGFDLFSAQEEVQAGQQAAAQVPKQLPVLPDSSPISQYVQRLGKQLAAHAPGEKWPYSFHVVNQKEINAFALPGGPVYVNLGTIQAADNEAELAGVIAHEISHVVQRHGTRSASKQMAAQLPLAILGGVMGRGALAQMASLGISFGANSYFLKNSRQSEKEADLLGADIMYDTGFDPHAMAQFFTKIQAQGGARSAQFFSDHPDPGNRVQYVSAEVRTLPAKSHYLGDSADFRQIKQEVSGMTPLTAQQIAAQQKQGGPASAEVSPGSDVSPSTRMQTLNHNDFQISYPENWQTFGDQTSSVTIAPQSGVSDNAVAFGVMISAYQPEDLSASLDQDTHELLASLRQSNPDLREIGSDETIRVNGAPGKSVDLIGNSPIQENGRPARERDWLVTTERRDGSLLYLVFIAPDKDFTALRPTFEQMLKSLRVK